MLILRGLYSYQKEQTIDFRTLTQAHLFGIFGPVGSGKSAILEAITYALYGKTDRLNLAGDNRNYNMMNLKSNELLIDFRFEAGKNHTAYKALVQGRRNSKRFENVGTLERSAFIMKDGQWSPVECSRLEEAAGLSYDNFKRTIIIPQGQFKEFLQLGNKERTQMMSELFNLQKFDLYSKVTKLEAQNSGQLQLLKGKIQQLGNVDPDQIKALEEKLQLFIQEISLAEENLKTLYRQETNWQQLKELSDKLEKITLTLNKLKSQEAQYNTLDKRISEYEQCKSLFSMLISSIEDISLKINAKKLQYEADTKKLKDQDEAIANTEQQFLGIKSDYDNRHELHQKAEEYGKLLEIKSLTDKIKINTERLEKGNHYVNEVIGQCHKLKEEKERTEIRIREFKEKLPDFAELSAVKGWYILTGAFDKQLHDFRQDIKDVENKITLINSNISAMLSIPVFKSLNGESDCLTAARFLHKQNEILRQKIKQLNLEADQMHVNQRLEQYAGSLKDGSPCPLCGSSHHPNLYNAETNRQALVDLEAKIKELEDTIQEYTSLVEQLNSFNNQLKLYSAYLEEKNLKLNEIAASQKQHESQFKWSGYDKPELVDNALDEGKITQNQLRIHEEKLADILKELDKRISDKEKFQVEVDKIKESMIQLEAEKRMLTNQMVLLHQENMNLSASLIEEEKNALIKKHAFLERQHDELTSELKELQRSRNTLAGILEAAHKNLNELNESHEMMLEQFQEKLIREGYHSADEVKQVLNQQLDVAAEKNKIIAFRENIALAIAQRDELLKEMDSRTYNENAHQLVKQEILSGQKVLTEKHHETGNLKGQLEKMQKDLTDLVELKKTAEQLELRDENIRTLKSLFMASRFVNYISSVYLRNLCNAANDRFFKLTRQKLSLEMTDDNNFQVRDYMNGGKVRSVKTLSGGQTFQASLSLALALADNIRQLNESNQNFFFLDEGFGSLDHDSLHVVFNTLRSLREENRVVGVISHVEEMQQEIDVHLRVENNEDQGSIIRQSWNMQ